MTSFRETWELFTSEYHSDLLDLFGGKLWQELASAHGWQRGTGSHASAFILQLCKEYGSKDLFGTWNVGTPEEYMEMVMLASQILGESP